MLVCINTSDYADVFTLVELAQTYLHNSSEGSANGKNNLDWVRKIWRYC
jgi:hypothetical protein